MLLSDQVKGIEERNAELQERVDDDDRYAAIVHDVIKSLESQGYWVFLPGEDKVSDMIKYLEANGYKVTKPDDPISKRAGGCDPLADLYGCLSGEWRTRGEALAVARSNGFKGSSDQTLYNHLIKHAKSGRIEQEGKPRSYRWRLAL